MTYKEKLESTKSFYPFEKWHEMFFPKPKENLEGMEQYTKKNCDAAKVIFDKLISGLELIGVDATEKEKIKLFKKATIALNKLNEKTEGELIETGEREDLCELIDRITKAVGLNPEDYADGEGIADEWREW